MREDDGGALWRSVKDEDDDEEDLAASSCLGMPNNDDDPSEWWEPPAGPMPTWAPPTLRPWPCMSSRSMVIASSWWWSPYTRDKEKKKRYSIMLSSSNIIIIIIIHWFTRGTVQMWLSEHRFDDHWGWKYISIIMIRGSNNKRRRLCHPPPHLISLRHDACRWYI